MYLFGNWPHNRFSQCYDSKSVQIISFDAVQHMTRFAPPSGGWGWKLALPPFEAKKCSPVYSPNTQSASLLRGHWPFTQQGRSFWVYAHVWDWTEAWNVQMEGTLDVNVVFFTPSHNNPPIPTPSPPSPASASLPTWLLIALKMGHLNVVAVLAGKCRKKIQNHTDASQTNRDIICVSRSLIVPCFLWSCMKVLPAEIKHANF